MQERQEMIYVNWRVGVVTSNSSITRINNITWGAAKERAKYVLRN